MGQPLDVEPSDTENGRDRALIDGGSGMAAPQPGILMEEDAHALYVVLRAKRGANSRALIKASARAPALTAALAR
ncbi:MAG: hypothetical protein EXQ98_04720 [Alphaproteobacteria bacterium]|nr:hypothetical protein [Alphaproteobacteria bacterium]